jgi:transposase IS4-like protein
VSDLPTGCPCSCNRDVQASQVWRRLGLGVLGEYVPAALIDEVLAATGRVQQRIRRLPSRVTVLFILALTLFSGQGYRGVWRELAHSGGAGDRPPPSSSGLAQARRRVGLAPLAALFARVRGTRATAETLGAFRFGLRLVAWDGRVSRSV